MTKIYATNKKIREYNVIESLEAGISLLGPEVKAIRNGNIVINEGFVRIKDGEAFLVNVNISPVSPTSFFEKFNPLRVRKLLLRKNQIKRLVGKIKEKGVTIIPSKVYTKGRWIKVEIALVRHKTVHDKRQKIIQREAQRRIKELLKHSRKVR
ncbi:MAG: SsrA-binding protein SmpB [bacterium]